ncbi:NADH:flavin oxidoreductase/NADH oxidase [Skermanella rosea]|uniref:NADH:flavin oxidoreductase/NADH oxidase n=1 Tax=Skermanella rosea TaxID=1817965 RepID=UPI001933C47F|nr:NADH:flavin oxidoreductase/NADH oxidase [Skermanella rosea]UEM04760.1 NADH:flavin oxidoreductase/NADH oxidase [Skermanella rosea]
MTSSLFTPIDLAGVGFANRIVVSPMCQYSAEDGNANDWHVMHLGMLANSGASLVILEATAVEPAGRITPGDLGLYNDENEAALARVMAAVRRYGTAKLGIQVSHAGRKASAQRPWEGGRSLPAGQGEWQTIAPSAIPFAEGWPAPRAFEAEDFKRVRDGFVATAKRAARLGFDLMELHGAHGYLLHSFLSPLANRREDSYGGDFDGRTRFPLEVFDAVREVWPSDRPLGIRISASDWVDGGWTIEESVAFAKLLKARGCDFIDCSSGGVTLGIKIPTSPGYQVPFSARVRREAEIPTMAVGLIVEPKQAERIVTGGEADMVALARTVLDEPHWGWRAARELGGQVAFPPQYARAAPDLWPGHSFREDSSVMD